MTAEGFCNLEYPEYQISDIELCDLNLVSFNWDVLLCPASCLSLFFKKRFIYSYIMCIDILPVCALHGKLNPEGIRYSRPDINTVLSHHTNA